jgi:isopentenyldiphosphate isomerase
MTEILDLVNENDQVIGEVERSVANFDPKKIHREIGILIVDQDDRILAQKRNTKKEDSNLWIISCAGHVKKAQTPDEAAHSELFEELGFDTDLIFVEKTFETTERESRFNYLYIGEFPRDIEIEFDSSEMSDVRWFSKEELEQALAEGEIFEGKSLDVFNRYWSRAFILEGVIK